MSDFQVITTPEELEELELNDADAIVLASEAGAVRTVRALAAMHRLESVWGLPAVVVASGSQVRAAREAMEKIMSDEKFSEALDAWWDAPIESTCCGKCEQDCYVDYLTGERK